MRTSDPSLWPSELGVTQAARFAGVPEVTLRLHVDQGKVLGVRRTPSGRRVISREGLLAYLQARGIEAGSRPSLPREGAGCIIRLPWGSARLERQRGRVLEVEFEAWNGLLPDPEQAVEFRIEEGALAGVSGEARVSWMLWKGGRLSLGLRAARDPVESGSAEERSGPCRTGGS